VRVAQLLVKFCLLFECLNVLGSLPQKFAIISLVGSSQGLQAIVLARSHINNLVNPTKFFSVMLWLLLCEVAIAKLLYDAEVSVDQACRLVAES
jgi:hypothetical protein